jgi:predicted dehydrogenase
VTAFDQPNGEVLRVAVVGCGDVAMRRYVPALLELDGRVEIVACCDPRRDLAERTAAWCHRFSPDTRTFTTSDALFASCEVDAVFNLTPIPVHGEETAAALEAGAHVFTEKPLAASLEEADGLIELARSRRLLFMSAPAVPLSPRIRWLRELVASGRLGSPTLATGFVGGLGAAAWREYTGHPAGAYRILGGPLLNMGVYLLYAFVELIGPVRAVQAIGEIAIPTRTIRSGPYAGETVEARAPDQFLVHLDFGEGCVGDLVASYAVPASRVPWLELHLTGGSASVGAETQWDADGPVDVFVDDPSPLGLEGWLEEARGRPDDPGNVVALGPPHFVDVLLGEAEPALRIEQARHVLEVCLRAVESSRDGLVHSLDQPRGAR